MLSSIVLGLFRLCWICCERSMMFGCSVNLLL